MQACDRCHSRKTRCDRRIPQCSACEKAGAACLHVDKLRQRNIPRGYVESIETQVEKLSEENRKLRGKLVALRNKLHEHSDSGERHETQRGGQNDESDGKNQMDQDRNTSNEINASASVDFSAAMNTGQDGLSSQEKGNSRNFNSPAITFTSNVNTEVEQLSLKATGEAHSAGLSSEVELASIIDSIVDSDQRVPLAPMDQKAPDVHNVHVIPSTPLDPSFPSITVAMTFIEAYFQHTHITFPLLHRPSFLRTVDLIYNQPTYYENHPYDSYTFNMVLAIGSSNFNRFDEATACPSTHYARARAGLKSVLGMTGLMPLKAIILLSQHGIFSNLRDTSASIYHLVGIAVRMCFEQGLHAGSKFVHGQQKNGLNEDKRVSFMEEMRRRCFWCLYNLDRVVSFTLGRPMALRDEDINISLPSHLEDEQFAPDRPIIEESGTESNSNLQSSPFLHLIRIRRLSGEIMSRFYSINQKGGISFQENLLERSKLHDELVSWRNDVHLLKLRETPVDEHAHISCFLTPEWYTAVYNNAMLLLYRPSPCLPQPSAAADMGNGGDHLKLFSAARETILAYADLHRRRRLNYSWITLHGVFVAGLAYVYSVGRALKDPDPSVSSFNFLDIIDDTSACSNVLVAISERWNTGHRFCELFNQLSTAVIRQVVNGTANRKAGSNEPSPNSNQVKEYTGIPGTVSIAAQRSLPLQQYDLSIDAEMLGSELLPGHVSVHDEFRNYSTSFDGMFVPHENYPHEIANDFSEAWTCDESFMTQGENGAHLQNFESLW